MPFTAEDKGFMREALAFARIAFSEREVPVGAVVVRQGKMIGRGRNRREALADPTHHAEMEAIREAAQAVGNWRLEGAALYTSVVSILTLYFQYIDRAFPDALVAYVDPYSSAIRFAIASLIVVTPLYVYLTRRINSDIRSMPEKRDLWVRRWLIYIHYRH